MGYKSFYDLVRSGKMSTTSQITAYTFEKAFSKYIEEGQAVIYIGFSSALSKTFENALMASNNILEKYPNADLSVIDSRSATVGLGSLVYCGCEMLSGGKNKEEIVNWLEDNKLKLNHWFTVDSLDHLKRGGRISATSAAIGSLLDVKPVLNVDDEGRLRSIKKVRGRKKAIKSLADELKAQIVNPEEQTIFISHGDCQEEAENLKNLITKDVKVKDVMINYIGPVIGTHTGAGVLCVTFFGTGRDS
ncbi:DegV family protein with EDD domain [Alkaliphilus hydrothermalis]|uniref:DegV family protein with EDD domain n=1 Tax=Alkaliphilus hydrothermalis TaxID=1482730 RepID=A0ABS2NT43_9FIRM|nr:DegV family protein with EDD domain [Alkaliphilus hydrothermalis]